MPKKAPELSALAVKRLHTAGLHAVGGVDGLHLRVKPSGARNWVLRVTIGDRRPDIGLGGFPDVELAQARARAREARDQIRNGIDPLLARRQAKLALKENVAQSLTFDAAAKMYYAMRKDDFSNKKHRDTWYRQLEIHAKPKIGDIPVSLLTNPDVLEVLTPLWTTKTETATRIRQRIEMVISWAITNGYRTNPKNPAKWEHNLEHALPDPEKIKPHEHFEALPWQEVGSFVAKLRALPHISARALEFQILTAARSGEVRLAQWSDVDLQAKVWTVPARHMKSRRLHRVPLSEPAIALLKSLPRFDGCEVVFPNRFRKMLSDMAMSKLMHDMGYSQVPHGFRSSFKDWARSSTSYPDEVSELALAHVSTDATRAAYARDELLPLRTKLMRDWARYCAQPPRKGNVVSIKSLRHG